MYLESTIVSRSYVCIKEKIDKNKKWKNKISISSHLGDVI